MDSRKKAAFVKAMGRKKFAGGGLVRSYGGRKYFDAGGLSTVVNNPEGAEGIGGNLIAGPTGAAVMTTPGGVPSMTGPTQGTYVSNPAVNNTATNPNTGVFGTINGGLGLNDQFQAGAANIQAGTNTGQINDAYSGAQRGLANQENLANTLNPQVGTAVQNQNNLAGQYSEMAQGRGPNPARAELAQNTANNVAQTGSQMAGMRGSSGNVGLMAREIGQQGAATQQAGVGQAATLEAQQQIAAQQNLANLSNNQISQAGQANTGMSSAQQAEQALLENANTSYNNAAVGMQSNMNNVNSQTAAANQNMGANMMGGMMSGVSSAMNGLSSLAKGGVVENEHLKLAEMNAHSLKHAQKYDEGGAVDQPDLGSFKPSGDSGDGPSVPATSTLPADTANFGTDMKSSGGSSGGGGGGGGMGLMALAAMADGGRVQPAPVIGPNPLLTSQQQMQGPGNWAAGYFNPSGSASSGPNMANTQALPGNPTNLSKSATDAANGMKKGQKKSAAPMSTPGGPTGDDTPVMNQMVQQDPYQSMDQSTNQPATDKAIPFKSGGNVCPGPHKSHVANFLFAGGGKVPAMVSPGEIYLTPEKVHRVIHEDADPRKIGEKFKGKAKVKGDSLKNDIIPRDLDEGGVVIDRKNVMSKEKSQLFVHKALARKKARG